LAAAGRPHAALELLDAMDVDAVTRRVDPFFRTIVHLRRAGWRARIGDVGGARNELIWHEHSDVVGLPTGLPQAAEVDWAFGTLEVTMDGAEAPAELLWKKNIALLLYLARSPKRRCTREQLIGLLWPDKDDTAARQSVREAIRMVRHYVGDRFTAKGDVIQLLDGAVELDTDQLEKLVKQRDWSQATPLINGPFLYGFKIPDSSSFEDWLTVERSHWDGLCIDALLRHAEERLNAGDELGADEPITKARKLDPLSQRAVRAEMRRLAGTDNRSEALRVFDDFAKQLQRDGGMAVEPETRALVDRLRSGRAWHLPKDVASRRAPLLGRDRELAAALAQWRHARGGRLTLLVIQA